MRYNSFLNPPADGAPEEAIEKHRRAIAIGKQVIADASNAESATRARCCCGAKSMQVQQLQAKLLQKHKLNTQGKTQNCDVFLNWFRPAPAQRRDRDNDGNVVVAAAEGNAAGPLALVERVLFPKPNPVMQAVAAGFVVAKKAEAHPLDVAATKLSNTERMLMLFASGVPFRLVEEPMGAVYREQYSRMLVQGEQNPILHSRTEQRDKFVAQAKKTTEE
jgi:hypothetical protein